ncbi:MAG: polysaccharide pyruvyl transferase family protein [Bacteroidales bacterium]|nr:polysaccharide pyruvyl transferase family protein [Bacteroidales bacterium]
MKKNVGILTTYFAANYGAMLQPFALKRVLEQQGCDVEMIRYGQPDILHHYNPFHWSHFFQPKITAALAAWLFFPWAVVKELRFRRFMYRYINPERGFVDSIPYDKEVYYIGSDQLWRTFGSDEHFDPVYTGFFTTKPGARKVSYAVSGEHLELNETNQVYMRRALSNFDMISVREESRARDFIPLAEGKSIEVVLDPTLLATPDLYQELESRDPLPGKRYAVFYCVRRSQNFIHRIYDFVQSKGCELLLFSEGIKPSLIAFSLTHRKVHYFTTAGEELFLGALQRAEYVFTPSFHGSVFAIINHRNLFSLLVGDGQDTRTSHLLNLLGMEHRLWSVDQPINEEPIAYEKVENILSEQRALSLNFIYRSLQ